MKSNVSTFSFLDHSAATISKKFWLIQYHKNFLFVCYQGFTALGFTIKSIIHLALLLVCGAWCRPTYPGMGFSFSHMDIKLYQIVSASFIIISPLTFASVS
jgi:hypothetical protein